MIGLRYFNIFGKGQTGSYAGVITQFMWKLSKKQRPKIFGDGNQIRDFIHVSDIAEANLSAMLSKTNSGFFNIGTGKGTKIIDLANKISSQSIEIYESAKIARDSIQKTSSGVDDVMRKIKDGRGSFLSKVDNLNKVGGLTPKKNIPETIKGISKIVLIIVDPIFILSI